MISVPQSKAPRWSIELAVLSCLVILYGPLLYHWVWDGWVNKNISIQHEYFSHGILGIPLAIKLVWDKRHAWQRLGDSCHWAGIGCLFIAFVFYTSGVMDAINLSLPLMLTGLLLCMKRTRGAQTDVVSPRLIIFSTPTQLPSLGRALHIAPAAIYCHGCRDYFAWSGL